MSATVFEHPEIDQKSFDDQLSTISEGSLVTLQVAVASDICDSYVPADDLDDTDKVLRIFLGRLDDHGLNSLAVEIYLYKNEPEKLRSLRNHLIDALLKPMLAQSRKTSIVAQPVQEDAQDKIEQSLYEIDSVQRDDKLRDACLKRDGGKCVVSQVWSSVSEERPAGESQCTTKCAHCLPFCLSASNGTYVQTKNIATIWHAYYRYFPGLQGAITSHSINQMPNALTLMDTLHRQFRKLEMAFKPTKRPNEYDIQWIGAGRDFFLKRSLPSTVKFIAHDDEDENLPNRDFLHCHHVLAEIYNDMRSRNLSLRLLRILPPAEKADLSDTLSFVGGAVHEATKKRKRELDLDSD